jgi:hypothetical protein
MKIQKLTITNIGMIENEVIPTESPLILFYGQIKQGKTTILNAIRYAFGGAFPADLLKHGQAEGKIRLDFADGYIERTFYRSDTGDVRARPLEYVIAGKRVAKPVDALKSFLNPFLLDQDHIVRMNDLERKKFFVDLFDAGTAGIDAALVKLENTAREVRAKLSGYGDLDLTEQKRVNVATLQAELATFKTKNQIEAAEAEAFNKNIETHNTRVNAEIQSREFCLSAIVRMTEEMRQAKERLALYDDWLAKNPPRTDKAEPELLDTSGLEKAISEAAAQNVRAEFYEKSLKREQTRKSESVDLSLIEAEERNLREARLKKLATVNEGIKIPGLRFDDDGQFSFENTTAAMLSTSQLMELSSKLSSLYPEGFGIELLDRGESLGRSIFDYVDRAKAENKTILATIVGERPTTVPENVGVFVVADGKLTK